MESCTVHGGWVSSNQSCGSLVFFLAKARGCFSWIFLFTCMDRISEVRTDTIHGPLALDWTRFACNGRFIKNISSNILRRSIHAYVRV